MPTKTWITIIIWMFAGLVLAVSLFTGDSIDQQGLRWVSGVSSAIILLIGFYDRLAWRWPLIRKIAEYGGRPVIRGTWKGVLEFQKDANGNPGKIDIYFSIEQTYSTVEVRGFVTTSESHSITATMDKPHSNQRRLAFAYHSGAPHGSRKTNPPHDGTALLNIVGIPVEGIEGSYYTDRGGSGKIRLYEFSPKLSESYKQASSRPYKRLS